MVWYYNGREVTDEDVVDYKTFVYCITNLVDGRKYVGKKRLKFVRRKNITGRKRKVTVLSDSDWKSYYGSSTELQSDVSRLGEACFSREIIRLCKSLSEANYYELREQMINDVLLKPNDYYNAYVGSRISRRQLGVK